MGTLSKDSAASDKEPASLVQLCPLHLLSSNTEP